MVQEPGNILRQYQQEAVRCIGMFHWLHDWQGFC
jgi:hypothetical protein